MHDRYVERVLLRIERHQEWSENAMIQTPADAFSFDASALQGVEDLVCELRRACVGILDFVVMRREAVVVVNETLGRCGVDFDGVAVALPVRGEDDDGFWFYFVSDFVADGLEFAVGWVRVVFEKIGPAWVGVSDVL